jgi:ATP/maltotriose-dependent transcriptional regulator MalT
MERTNLIGRETEQNLLAQQVAAIQGGVGGMLLLAGIAGVGKTALLEYSLAKHDLLVLQCPSHERATPPFGPIATALREYLRTQPNGLAELGSLMPYLALLLPELSLEPPQSDQTLLAEAICQAFCLIGRAQPCVVLFEDLQWADNATLELLPRLAGALAHEPLLLIGIYRSDEIGRGHALRRMRNSLRRAHQFRELVVEPLDSAHTAQLAEQLLGHPLPPALATQLYEHTEGVPLFVKEVVHMIAQHEHLQQQQQGFELQLGSALPFPETLRDAVQLRLDGLPEDSLRLLEIAAVAGRSFDQLLVAELAGTTNGFEELVEAGLLLERGDGHACFRHSLFREAIYSDISWVRRRTLHHQIAERLQDAGASALTLAQHWLAAKESEQARIALLAAAEQACSIHAYRDAADAALQALKLWPADGEQERRIQVLDRLGQCAQLCGMHAEAAQSWEQAAQGYLQMGNQLAYATTQRKVANLATLQGQWEQAMSAHERAAQAFASIGQAADAAIELIAAAEHLRSAGQYRSALELVERASVEARASQRADLQARLLGLQGNLWARQGRSEKGLTLVQQGLELALQHHQINATAEIYQRLADALEHTGDYTRAKATYQEAFNFCQTNAIPTTAQICMACLTVVLTHTGEWERAMSVCRDVLASEQSVPHARTVASGMLGILYLMRGQPMRAHTLLQEAATLAQYIELGPMVMFAHWGLAVYDEFNGDYDSSAEHYHFVLARWEQLEDCHYVVPILRWGVSFFAQNGAEADARACANALARICSTIAQPEPLSALAHALGEIALLEGDTQLAIQQFTQSLDLMRNVNVPYCQAISQFRTGIAYSIAHKHDQAISYLTNAYRIARRLGARPFANRVTQALSELGVSLSERIGKNAEARFHSGNLTRRQHEILQLVAQGQTNSEIARNLVLSPRTVEMHVANILATLDSRSRAEAVRRATELNLLTQYSTVSKKIP